MSWKILEIDEREIAAKYQIDPLRAKLLSAAQLSDEEFRNACDFIIDNSGSLSDSERQIEEHFERNHH